MLSTNVNNKEINANNPIKNNSNINDSDNNTLSPSVKKDIIQQFHESDSEIFSNIFDKSETIHQTDIFGLNHLNFDNVSIKNSEILKPSQQKKLFVNFKNSHFNFYDERKKPLGSFDVFDILKFFSQHLDKNNEFLSHIGGEKFDNSLMFIKKFIGHPVTSSDKTLIQLWDFNQSYIMGDLELLIQLNNELYKFETNHLYKELNRVQQPARNEIHLMINKLIYTLLNYTLGIISLITSELSNIVGKNKLKEKLMKYSTNIVYRISIFTQNQIKIVLNKNEELSKLTNINLKLKNLLNMRIKKCTKDVNSINQLIKNVKWTNTTHRLPERYPISNATHANHINNASHINHTNHTNYVSHINRNSDYKAKITNSTPYNKSTHINLIKDISGGSYGNYNSIDGKDFITDNVSSPNTSAYSKILTLSSLSSPQKYFTSSDQGDIEDISSDSESSS